MSWGKPFRGRRTAKRKKLTGTARVVDLTNSAVANLVNAVIAIDPDLHTVGMAGIRLDIHGSLWVGATHVSKELKGQQCSAQVFNEAYEVLAKANMKQGLRPLVVVEGQRIRTAAGAETKNPQSIVELATAAGACVGAARAYFPDCPVMIVEPAAWKGTVPKLIHHKRICHHLGWSFESLKTYIKPLDPTCDEVGEVKPADYKHILDAIGMAQWARDRIKLARSRAKRRSK